MANLFRRPSQHELFSRDLRKVMTECAAQEKSLALLVIQIEQLDKVEGTLGYTASHALADELCDRLRETLREHDQLLKVGDRKYWAILPGPKNEGHAILAANKLALVAQVPFSINDHSVKVETVIGIAMFPEHATEPEDLVRRSDLALAKARELGVPYQMYSVDSTREMASLWQIEDELDRGLQESELELYYQPKIDLRTFKPCGAEALLRWNNPTRGLLGPDIFLPIAEQSGKMDAITSFVLDAAQRQRCEWTDLWGELPVAVNVSPTVLDAGRLIEFIKCSMQIWGSNTDHLILEVTEDSVVKDPDKSFAALAQLRAEGIKVAIDDFGTGYSSMTYFKELPADELKIDKSFITNLVNDEANRHIVRAIISLAHTFDYTVVAEGVEDEATLRQLVNMHCDIAQGFLLSCPLPQREFRDWLEDYQVPDFSVSPMASATA